MARTRKKGQAALEYLTTWGWLLIILILVGAAMAGLGLFKKSTYQPDICSGFSSGLAYVDHQFKSDGTVTIVLNNNLGKAITDVTNVTLTSQVSPTDTFSNSTPYWGGGQWDAGDKRTIEVTSWPYADAGSTYSVSVTITYDTEGLLGHLQGGICTGKYE